MKKTVCIILTAVMVLSLCGCALIDKPGYEKTEATEKAIADYLAAVENSVNATGGKLSVKVRCNDTVVEKRDLTELYEYTYSVDENGKESFDYISHTTDGKCTGHIRSEKDGTVTDVLHKTKTENYEQYLTHEQNPLSTLTAFRMDANGKLRHSTIASITETETAGVTEIHVVFHADKLTGLSIKNENGLNRTIKSHERTYVIYDGKIVSVTISDRENAQYNNETGTIDTDTTVEVSYQ